jgi:hypothetical protein
LKQRDTHLAFFWEVFEKIIGSSLGIEIAHLCHCEDTEKQQQPHPTKGGLSGLATALLRGCTSGLYEAAEMRVKIRRVGAAVGACPTQGIVVDTKRFR